MKTRTLKKSNDLDINDLFQIKPYKNKYRQTAEAIYPLLGGTKNYQNPWNCMTRFRVNIKDKNKVNLEKLKKLSLVKGINWNGEQLQIIIGGEVVKVMDEFKKYELDLQEAKIDKALISNYDIKQNNSPKKGTFAKIMAGVSGIITPNLVPLMAMGIFSALQAILLETNVIVNVNNMMQVGSVDLFSGIMYIIPKMLLNCLGIFFIYTTVKYLGGNPLIAISVGIILISRGFFADLYYADINDSSKSIIMDNDYYQTAWENASFGQWVNYAGKEGWLLFKLGDLPVVIGAYEGSILPFIAAGFLITYFDKWIKTWMPSVIDILFRPALVILITLLGIWFILGPILGILEFGITQAMLWIGNDIPFGIGVAIFAALWQPIVLTGMHLPIVVVGILPTLPSTLLAGIAVATFAQTGAGLGILIKTKNANLKAVAMGGVVSGIFGVTEPIIFGINLPRLKPFLFGVIAAFFAGLLSGALGIDADSTGGLGVFQIINYSGNSNMNSWLEKGLVILTWIVAMTTAGSLTFFFATEKVNEEKVLKKALNKVYRLAYSKNVKEDRIIFNKIFEEELNQIKKAKVDFKAYLKYLSINSGYEQQLVKIEEKESKHRAKIYQKIMKLQNIWNHKKSLSNDQQNQLKKLKAEYESYNLETQKEIVNQKIQENHNKYKVQIVKLQQEKDELYETLIEKVNKNFQAKINNDTFIEAIDNLFYNGINAADISYQLLDKKPVNFKNKKIEKSLK